jgi:23S rRNA (cytidine1920-2'-O)/16S rRNA (cytidine1409-2'-O)-methyltransferase
MPKIRIDELLVEKGFAEDTRHATALLMSGIVRVNGRRVDKAGEVVEASCVVEIRDRNRKYVSRGGEKLAGALDEFGCNPDGMVCLDLGASTGGFTDCLLRRGASKVYAFDVGKGQLDWKLRLDSHVVVREDFNVRHLTPDDIPEPVDLIVADLSFISLIRVFPALAAFPGAKVIVLVKPQFEAGPGEIEHGGVVRNEQKRLDIIERTVASAQSFGFTVLEGADSVLTGPKGNREYFLYLQPPGVSNLQ